jgi:hypothetical protein
MFYERDILEGLTKKTFYDSPRIDLTDLEQSLLEKTSTSLVCSIIYKHVDTAIKCVTSTCWISRSSAHPKASFRLWPCHAKPSSSAAAVRAKRRRSSAVPIVHRRPAPPSVAGPVKCISSSSSRGRVRDPSRTSFFFLFHPVQGAPARCGVCGESNQPVAAEEASSNIVEVENAR